MGNAFGQGMRPDGEESTPSNAPLTVEINRLDDAVPGLALRLFVRGLGITQSTLVTIANPAFLREVQTMLRDEPVSSWQSYLRWQFLRSVSPALPRALAAESFAFEQGVLGGRLQDMPRWKRAVIWADNLLGDDLGYLYVAERFTPQTFDPDASDEVNYAQIGSVMGHELTHLFRWTGEDEANFRARALAIEQQYSAYTLPDGSHLNGKLTLSENIADIGGLRLAYLAWKASRKSVRVVVVGDDLTPDQRFFIAYAQSWRIQTRPETARLRLVTDPHAPGHFRIVGPLSYMPEFYEAFRRSNSPAQVVHESLW